jgi:hypothetical protein
MLSENLIATQCAGEWAVRHRASNPRQLLAFVLPLALAFAACGGSDDPAPTSELPTATAAPFTTPSPVVFEHDPEVPVTQADLDATAEATGCPVSTYTSLDLPETPLPVLALVDDGITAIPDTWFGGRWYEGSNWTEWQSEVDGAFAFTAEPRDSASDAEPISLGDVIYALEGGFTEIVFSDPGCWDAHAVVGNQQLDFTVWVLPFEQRSDMAPVFADYEARIPFPVPADCAVTAIDDIDVLLSARSRSELTWSVEGDGLTLHGELPLLFAGENILRWYPEPWATVIVNATLAGSGMPALITYEIRTTDVTGEQLATTLLFPSEGCWTLHAETEATEDAPARTLDATVYVYPEGCRTEQGQPLPETCERALTTP